MDREAIHLYYGNVIIGYFLVSVDYFPNLVRN